MKVLFGLFAAVLLTSCQTSQLISYTVNILPQQSLNLAPQKVLLLNTFDPAVYHHRKNKESLVAALTDTLLNQMAAQLKYRSVASVPLYGLTPVITTADEGSIQALLLQHGATHAVVIKEVDVFFDQSDVIVTKSQSGKSREAFYDICTEITYELYDTTSKIESKPVRLRTAHSSRPVVSGLLAVGPSLASNADDFYYLASQNKDRFLHPYFGGYKNRRRPLFTTGAFTPVGTAVSQQNFETALKESLRLTESRNRETVAKAYYNCAVLAERLNNLETAKKYLYQSLRIIPLPEAEEMDAHLVD